MLAGLLLLYSVRLYGHMRYAAVRFPSMALQLGKDKQCILQTGQHEYHTEVLNHWCIGQWCLLLLGNVPRQPDQRVVLAPDVITEHERRYLRRWLKGYEN